MRGRSNGGTLGAGACLISPAVRAHSRETGSKNVPRIGGGLRDGSAITPTDRVSLDRRFVHRRVHLIEVDPDRSLFEPFVGPLGPRSDVGVGRLDDGPRLAVLVDADLDDVVYPLRLD